MRSSGCLSRPRFLRRLKRDWQRPQSLIVAEERFWRYTCGCFGRRLGEVEGNAVALESSIQLSKMVRNLEIKKSDHRDFDIKFHVSYLRGEGNNSERIRNPL
jgi:hypothetical protein